MHTRVLVIDDEEALLEMLEAALGLMGCQAVTAPCLARGRERAQDGQFDLVLLDNHFPDGHADAMMPVLADAQPQAPVVIITANDTDAHVQQALRLGAAEVLSKPFGLDELGEVVQRYCASQEAKGVA
ncbi:response regulator [bacterium]|nr:response regulator [bacterium]